MKPRTQWDASWFPFTQSSKQFETHICQAPINKSPSAIHVGQLRRSFSQLMSCSKRSKTSICSLEGTAGVCISSLPWWSFVWCFLKLGMEGHGSFSMKGMGHFPLRLPSAQALIIQVKWIKTNWKASPLDDITQTQQPALYPHPLTDSWCFDTPCWWYPPWDHVDDILPQLLFTLVDVGRSWQMLPSGCFT